MYLHWFQCKQNIWIELKKVHGTEELPGDFLDFAVLFTVSEGASVFDGFVWIICRSSDNNLLYDNFTRS